MFDTNTFQTAWSNISKNLSPEDYLIILGYLVITMVIGLKVGGNVKSIKEYAIGGKNFTMPVLLATLLATMIGAEDAVGEAEMGFSMGLLTPVLLSFIPIGAMYVFIGKYIAPRMYHYIKKDTITMGDLMGDFYGSFGRTVVSISGILLYIGFVAVQLFAMGVLLYDLSGADQNWCIIIGGAFIISYCAVGGIKAVTFTDVFQFIVLITAIPFVSNEIVHAVGGFKHVMNSVPDTHIYFWQHEDFLKCLLISGMWLIPGYEIGPAIVQRFLMTDDYRDISRAFYLSAVLTILFAIVIILISFAAITVHMPAENAEFTMSYMIKNYAPVAVKGTAIAGILAIVMSSVDSMLNSSGILIAHDIMAPIAKKYDLKNFNELKWARGSTVVVGIISILIALLSEEGMLSIEYHTLLLWSPIVSVPFLAYILGMRPKIQTFKASTVAVLTVGAILWLSGLDDAHVTLAIMLLTNIIVFFGVHKIVGPSEKPPLPSGPKIDHSAYNWLARIRDTKGISLRDYTSLRMLALWLLGTPKRLIRGIINFSTARVEQYGANYVDYGILCILCFIFPYSIWEYSDPKYSKLITMLRLSICLMVACMFFKEQMWPARLRPYFASIWHFTVMYSLPFYTTFVFFLQHGDPDWLLNMGLTIFLLSALVDWLSFIVLIVIGGLLGALAASMVLAEPLRLATDFNSIQMLGIMTGLAALIIIIFSRRQEIAHRDKIETMKMFGGAIAHEVRTPLVTVEMCNKLTEDLLILRLDEKKTTNKDGETTYELTAQLHEEEFNMLQTSRGVMAETPKAGMQMVDVLLMALKSRIPNEEKGLYSLKSTIKVALESYAMTPQERERVTFDDKFEDIYYYSSQECIKHLFYNLIKNAFKYALNIEKYASLKIWVEGNRVYIKDNGPGINKKKINKIFDKFYTTSDTGTGIGLSFCQMVMRDLDGEIDCKSEEGKYTTFILTFPPVDELILARLAKQKKAMIIRDNNPLPVEE
jgi:Na+/proline symporter/signal transduction histidine kinase